MKKYSDMSDQELIEEADRIRNIFDKMLEQAKLNPLKVKLFVNNICTELSISCNNFWNYCGSEFEPINEVFNYIYNKEINYLKEKAENCGYSPVFLLREINEMEIAYNKVFKATNNGKEFNLKITVDDGE